MIWQFLFAIIILVTDVGVNLFIFLINDGGVLSMEFRYSDRMPYLRASEIRELLKIAEQPGIISFGGGFPAPELFPVEDIKKALCKVLDVSGQTALQYSATEGFDPLRKIIAEQRMKPAGVNTSFSNILITNGSQQGLDFSGKIFLNPGDVVICESPSYLGAINAFRAYQPKFVEVATDDDGIIVEELEKALKENPNAKFIYLIPDFQNPSGKTIALDRRPKIVELATKYDVPIVEDNPYGELRFEGERLPALKSFDKDGVVIYLGTFSKTFCPGFRLGWVCADPAILSKYIIVKQGADLQPNTIAQRAAAAYMEEHNLNEHIEKIKAVYKKRRDVMINAIRKEFPAECKYTYPQGGLFTWVEIRSDLNSVNVLEEALKQKVAFVPGNSFFPNGGKDNFFRLNYSYMPEDKIVEGIQRLGSVLKSL